MTDKLPIEERKTPYTPDVISRLTQNWFAGQPDAQILLTTDKRATGDNAPYTGIGFGLHDFMAMLRDRDSLAAQLAAIRAETVEACAKKIPTNWLDPLLTGPNAVLLKGEYRYTPKHVERLLTALRERIRSLQHAEPQQ